MEWFFTCCVVWNWLRAALWYLWCVVGGSSLCAVCGGGAEIEWSFLLQTLTRLVGGGDGRRGFDIVFYVRIV